MFNFIQNHSPSKNKISPEYKGLSRFCHRIVARVWFSLNDAKCMSVLYVHAFK